MSPGQWALFEDYLKHYNKIFFCEKLTNFVKFIFKLLSVSSDENIYDDEHSK